MNSKTYHNKFPTEFNGKQQLAYFISLVCIGSCLYFAPGQAAATAFLQAFVADHYAQVASALMAATFALSLVMQNRSDINSYFYTLHQIILSFAYPFVAIFGEIKNVPGFKKIKKELAPIEELESSSSSSSTSLMIFAVILITIIVIGAAYYYSNTSKENIEETSEEVVEKNKKNKK